MHGFANDRVLVLLVEGDERRVEVWDTAGCKRVRSIPLDSKLDYQTSPSPTIADHVEYCPDLGNLMALSGNGRYAAVAGPTGIHLLSLYDGKFLRTITLRQWLAEVSPEHLKRYTPSDQKFDFAQINAKHYVRLHFLPTGDRLAIMLRNSDSDRGSRALATQWQYNITQGTFDRHEVLGSPATLDCLFDPQGLISVLKFDGSRRAPLAQLAAI